MADTDFSIKLDGTGMSIDRKISQELATRIMMLVLSDGKTDIGAKDDGSAGAMSGGLAETHGHAKVSLGKLSLSEYFTRCNATMNTRRILAIGAYSQAKQNRAFFTRAEVDSGFEAAKAKPPKNPTRDIAATIKLGWIAPSTGVDDQYYVTATGETLLENKFARQKGEPRRRRRRPKKTTKKTA